MGEEKKSLVAAVFDGAASSLMFVKVRRRHSFKRTFSCSLRVIFGVFFVGMGYIEKNLPGSLFMTGFLLFSAGERDRISRTFLHRGGIGIF